MKHTLHFFKAFIRQPRRVSSVIPTAHWNAHHICSTIPRNVRQFIVEYGPGTGVITDYLLYDRRIADDCVLYLIEQDPELTLALKEKYNHDKRVHVFTESAENIRSIVREAETVDHVIASIPFSTLPEDIATTIIEHTHELLKPGGELTVFQISKKVIGMLQHHTGFTDILAERLYMNLPPLTVIRAKKLLKRNAPDVHSDSLHT